MSFIQYKGPLFGRIGRRYIPVCMLAEEVDQLQADHDKLLEAIKAFRDAKGRYHTQKAAEKLISLIPANNLKPCTPQNPKA